MIKQAFIAASFTVLLACGNAVAQNQVTVNWSNDSSTLLRDQLNNPLTTGAAGNSNGDLVQLGYYDAATALNPFLGNWVPLTGAGLALTTIGDSPNGIDLPAGRIGFSTTFSVGSNNVAVIDADFIHTSAYLTQSSLSVTQGTSA